MNDFEIEYASSLYYFAQKFRALAAYYTSLSGIPNLTPESLKLCVKISGHFTLQYQKSMEKLLCLNISKKALTECFDLWKIENQVKKEILENNKKAISLHELENQIKKISKELSLTEH